MHATLGVLFDAPAGPATADPAGSFCADWAGWVGVVCELDDDMVDRGLVDVRE